MRDNHCLACTATRVKGPADEGYGTSRPLCACLRNDGGTLGETRP